MNLDIDLINSLKVGEYIKISDNKEIACLKSISTGCDNCFFLVDKTICPNCISSDREDKTSVIYRILK